MAREYFSKVVAIWWPTFAFVALGSCFLIEICVTETNIWSTGLDHVVANMFFIPTAIFHDDPMITTSFYIWKSLIPALIGNIIGGGLFVGMAYWYLHASGEAPIAVDGALYAADQKPLMGHDSTPSEASDERKRSHEAAGPEQMV